MLPSATRTIVANFFTPSYRIVGKVGVGNSGLIGLLNNPTTSLVEVHDGSVARLHEPKRLADRFDVLQIVKRALNVIALGHREEVGPENIIRGGTYSHVYKYTLRAITSSFEMEGVLEWTRRFELGVMLTEYRGDFFPLFEAKMRAIQFPDLELESAALLFNRHKLDIVSVLSGITDS